MARVRPLKPSLSSLFSLPYLSPVPLFLLCLIAGHVAVVQAQPGPTWSTVPFNTQSIPLAVKNPCNSVWAPQASGPAPVSEAWPRLWNDALSIKGWYASVRVDGTPYQILGGPTTIATANQTAAIVTPTRSSYLLDAGPIVINMTFFSPIEPADPVKMSSPFSYLYLTFTSNDTNTSHDVELYSDISGEWISGDDSLNMTWSGSNDGSVTMVQASLLSPQTFQINSETCQDGTVYYAMQSSSATSWQIGPSSTLRPNFAAGTALTNSASAPSLSVQDDNFTTFGIAVNVGSVSTTSSPVVYAIGIVRDPVIQYTNQQLRSPYYRISYSNASDLISAVLNNFTDSVTAAQKLDSQLAAAGGAISGNYSDLLAISTRQAFGAFDLTVPQPSSGSSTNGSDVKAFAKDFGNLGSGGVNAVDVLYAAMPAYIYLWPELLGYLLEPLFEYQETPQYTNDYAAEDIGGAYPNATGNSGAHNTQIEQSANMIIMALAHAQTTGDGSLLSRHYNLLHSWAGFLVNNTLAPITQETTSISDGIDGANQTNLALKGIIGIGAMAKISQIASKSNDSSNYQSIATQYAQQWQSLSITSDFISLIYGSGGSGVIYNLYADKLLQTNLIDSSVFNLQTSYYESEALKHTFGVPLSDSNVTLISRTDWTMFAAAAVTDPNVQALLVGGIHGYASVSLRGMGNLPFTVVYDPGSSQELTGSGDTGGINSFSQGAMFAPLALNVPLQSITFSNTTGSHPSGPGGDPDPAPKTKTNVGAIAGGIVGGLAVLGAGAFLAVFLYRRRDGSPHSQYNHKDRIKSSKPEPGVIIEPYTDDARANYQDGSQPVTLPYERSRDRLVAPTSTAGSSGSRDRLDVDSSYDSPSMLLPADWETSNFATTLPSEASETLAGAPSHTRYYEKGRRLPPPPPPVPGPMPVMTQDAHERSLRPSLSTRSRTEPLAHEVAELRREIERMRMDQQQRTGHDSASELGGDMPPPPSYDLALS